MKILYKFQESKKGEPDGGEDRLVVTDSFIAVIDGATSKTGERYDGRTGGVLAAEAIAEATQALPRKIEAPEVVARFTEAVRDQVLNRYAPHIANENCDYTGDRPRASVILYSAEKREIWRVGDCHFKIGQYPANRGRNQSDAISSEIRAAFLRSMLDNQTATIEELQKRDMGRERIMPILLIQPLLINNPNSSIGYGVIDGRSVPSRFIEVYPVGKGEKRIMLASDGVLEDLRNYDDTHCSINRLLEAQLQYYREDPLLIARHKSTKGVAVGQKWHDDVTVVEFEI